MIQAIGADTDRKPGEARTAARADRCYGTASS